ncbi:MAG: PIG-L family deacetylase [Acidobacteriota bacterium]
MKLNRLPTQAITFVLVFIFALGSQPSAAQRNAQSPYDQGAMGLGQAIKRLSTIASALHTGAHPDDEDSGLLAYLARGRQSRTAYLSLTRGDGGQNLIGPELYESLGVIRTEELLAARRLDGAGQFFTRAYDFGFSKSRDEAMTKWNREETLADIVRVIRTFRPMVVVSAWSGTPRDGHGQHQAAGLLTQEAVRAASDPARFSDQIKEGLRPWRVLKFYQRAPARNLQREGAEPSGGEPPTVSINTGQFDPLLGQGHYEIAMQGRSQHRSQDQGALQRRGPRYSALKILESAVGSPREEKDIFQGIDTSLAGITAFAPSAGAKLKDALAEAQRAADEAREKFNPFTANSLSPVIARGLGKLREARASLSSLGLNENEIYEVDFLLKQKEQDFITALALSSGVAIDCIAEDEIVTPAQTFNVNVAVYAAGDVKLQSISLPVADGWSATKEKETASTTDGRMIAQTDFKITVARDARPTAPYWLGQPRHGDMFTPLGGSGIEPLSPPVLSASVEIEIARQKIALNQPAQYRYADKAMGEIRRDLKVAPLLSVNVSPHLIIVPISTKQTEREVTVELTNNSRTGARGTLNLARRFQAEIAPAKVDFDLKRKGERASFTFTVKFPPQRNQMPYQIHATANVAGESFRRGYTVISYPHTETRLVYRDAIANARVIDVRVAPGLKVGYIEGAGDDFANALRRIDVDVRTIDARELATGDLNLYDAIVMGIRAYEVRPDVVANNNRLLEYIRRGGVLIVQYNKNEYAAGNFAPFPVKMKQTADRVTDERAPVTIVEPSHPRFNFPNKITERDFEGWVHERGTYFFSEWDANYKPLLSSRDAGEEAKLGGELIAEYGSGLFVYTGYTWFRQLPEGVPGAYRLIANLVSLPKARASQTPAR